uniref:Saposin B-type domain-containing protein n=1 Tax=Apteryx owenii TaxID=8824 RepID=A0A8B9S712_APTOW
MPVPLPLCWLCRTFIARAEATIPKVPTAVARLCRVLPAAAAGACRCLAERYTILLLDALLGKLGPRLLCSALFSCGTQDDCAPVAPGGPRAPTGAHGDKGWDGSALGQVRLCPGGRGQGVPREVPGPPRVSQG